ncbi:MAG: lasso peptide biosynthesis B2 protein, partial [Candidatus Acidiferrales bacterium]
RRAGLKIMRNAWQTFWRLSGYERSVAVEAAAALAATWVGLRLTGFRRWKRLLENFVPATAMPTTECAHDQRAAAQMIARMESAAVRRLFFRTNCLEQSLVLWWLLRRRGMEAELRVGGRKRAGAFEAHAWVSLAGTAIDLTGDTHLHFAPFDGPLNEAEAEVRAEAQAGAQAGRNL